MKKCLLMAALVAITFVAGAQTKGTNLVGIGFYSYNNNTGDSDQKEKSAYTNMSLNYGYFIKDNARINLGYSFGDQEYMSTDKTYGYDNKNSNFSFSYVNYHTLAKKLSYTVQKSISFGSFKNQNFNAGNWTLNSKGTNVNLGLNVGLAYFISKRFMFEAEIIGANATFGTEKSDTYSVKTRNIRVNTAFEPSYVAFRAHFLF
jgi:hypothetical protein